MYFVVDLFVTLVAEGHLDCITRRSILRHQFHRPFELAMPALVGTRHPSQVKRVARDWPCQLKSD